MAFTNIHPFPGVWHIQDAMGVCMTLIAGNHQALLIDTGYGLEDVSSYINTLTDLPVRVILTHGHHDHMLGARWFKESYMSPADQDDFLTYTGSFTRNRILKSAKEKGIFVNEGDFLNTPIAMPKKQLPEQIDLGGLKVEIISCPGHTPGSLVVWIPEYGLLLTGDDWNPCTWLFFAKALSINDYRNNMMNIVRKIPAKHVLCSHQPMLFSTDPLYQFLDGLTDECLMQNVSKPDLSPDPGIIDVRECSPADGQIMVFDWNKFAQI